MCIPQEVELEFELDWEEVEFADLLFQEMQQVMAF